MNLVVSPSPCVEIIAPREAVQVRLRRSPFADRVEEMDVPAGQSVAEILETLWREHDLSPRGLVVHIDGVRVPKETWERVRLKPGRVVTITRVPLGKAARQLLLVAVAVVALVVANVVAGPLIGAIFGTTLSAAALATATSIAVGVIGTGLTIAGSLAVNALFPAAKPKSNLAAISGTDGVAGSSSERSPTYAIGGGRNDGRPYQPIPDVLGRHRVSPPYAAASYTEIFGDEQYLRQIFVWGYGPLDVSDIRIGETPISNFTGVELVTYQDHTTAGTLGLFPSTVFEEPLQIDLTGQVGVWQTRTTADDMDEVFVDILFPQGLYALAQSNGQRYSIETEILIQYKLRSSSTWISAPSLYLQSNEQAAIRRSMRVVTGARGQYDVRVSSNTQLYSSSDYYSQDVYWSALRGFRFESPVKFPEPLTVSTLRIRATAQLNGTVDTLNGVCARRMKVWSGSAWVNGGTSSNPADLFRYVLQSPANEQAVEDAEIDLAALQLWHAYCVTNGFAFNQVRDFKRSVRETLNDIAAAGRATVSEIGGIWSVIWDRVDLPVVQMFTPRNSREFESVRAYLDLPHAFRVRFINEENGWLEDERIVYDDGYSASNAQTFEALEFPGVTKPALIWKLARYHIAQLRLRRSTYSIVTDWENLVCDRGDLVLMQHDVPMWGLGSARVRSVATVSGIQTVTLDDHVPMMAAQRYTMRVRTADGEFFSREVVANAGDQRVLELVGSGTMPVSGDLIAFGRLDTDTRRMRVLSKEPLSDLAAKLFLVDEAPAILTADQGPIPAFVSGTPAPLDYWLFPPRDLQAVELLELFGGGVRSRINLSWLAPTDGIVSSYVVEVFQNGEWGTRQFLSGSTTAAVVHDLAAGSYHFRVRALFATGQVSDWRVIENVSVNLLATIPADVQNFDVTIVGDIANLSWAPNASLAVSHYKIKFSPALTGVSWPSSSILVDNVKVPFYQTVSQPGTWLIKAVTYSGLESANAVLVVSSVGAFANFNVVEALVEHPAFTGTKSAGVARDDEGHLRLVSTDDIFAVPDMFGVADMFYAVNGVPSQGVYGFSETIDLGQIYTVRLSALIDAYGEAITADMFAPTDMFAVDDMFSVSPSQWDVTIQYRATTDDPGSSPIWTAWSALVIGDVTARAFQFRAVLTSTQPNVTPVITALSVSVDMPDRVIADNNLVATTAGRTISFVPALRELQGLGIAASNMATGDYYSITAKSEAGFTIQFFNASNAPVERQFDFIAKGYGAVT